MRDATKGAVALQVVVILAPVLLVLMGLAVDLGRIYLIKGELKNAANAMALSAAQQLSGTDQSTELATAAALRAVANTNGLGNKYDFAGLVVGQDNGFLTSTIEDTQYFDTAAAAIGEGEDISGSAVSGAAARHARVTLRADAPLLFFGLIPLGFERKTPVAMRSVAGMSAPLCTACGIEAIAVAALSAEDGVDFGFVRGTRYTLGYQCTGAPAPAALPNTSQRIPYLLLDKNDVEATLFADESSQLYRIGSGGLPASTSEARSCFQINSTNLVWASASVLACGAGGVQNSVRHHFCGLQSRFDSVPPEACNTVAEVETLSTLQPVDSDLSDLDDYAAYTGNRRRVITVPIVDALAATSEMTVLGFRQFLIEPSNGTNVLNLDAQNARFPALYIGSAVPLKQGRFSGCSISSGPGRAVLLR